MKLLKYCFLIMFFFSGCSSNIDQDWTIKIPPQKYARDSLYIAFTNEKRLEEVFGKPGHPDTIFVEDIYYGPDTLKLFALISQRVLVRQQYIDQRGVYTFSGLGYVGYRDSLTTPWKLYAFGKYMIVNQNSREDVISDLKRYFFNELKDDSEFILNSKGEIVSEKFGANLGEKAFWNSLIWQKGKRLPNLYNFQVNLQDISGDTNKAVKKQFDPIQYPDSLIDLYIND